MKRREEEEEYEVREEWRGGKRAVRDRSREEGDKEKREKGRVKMRGGNEDKEDGGHGRRGMEKGGR